MYRKIKINHSKLFIRNFASKKMVKDIAKVLKLKKTVKPKYISIENTFFK